MAENPDRISVQAQKTLRVHPESADVVFQVEGHSIISTSQAMKKAKEVEKLISALDRAGVSHVSAHVDSVEYESSKGIISGSSGALFKVEVIAIETDQVPLCLGVGANQKGVSVEAVRWNYGKLHQERLDLLGQVTTVCREYADAIAKSLGIIRGLIHYSHLEWQEPGDMVSYLSENFRAKSLSSAGMMGKQFNFPVQKRGQLGITMKAEFRCSEV